MKIPLTRAVTASTGAATGVYSGSCTLFGTLIPKGHLHPLSKMQRCLKKWRRQAWNALCCLQKFTTKPPRKAYWRFTGNLIFTAGTPMNP